MVTIYYYYHETINQSLASQLFSGSQQIVVRRISDRPNELVSKCQFPIWLYHIDLTNTSGFPICRQALNSLLKTYEIEVWNGDATDISKRYIQEKCREIGLNDLSSEARGDPEELLIVKSNYNVGGSNEIRYRRAFPNAPIDAPKLMRSCNDYKVLLRKDIPSAWFGIKELHIEKYVSNREDIIFRAFYLLGRVVIVKKINPNKIKKGRSDLKRWLYSDQDTEVAVIVEKTRLLARKMHIDFCAMDILQCDNGEFYFCDVNTTPFLSRHLQSRNCQTPNFTDADMLEYFRTAVSDRRSQRRREDWRLG